MVQQGFTDLYFKVDFPHRKYQRMGRLITRKFCHICCDMLAVLPFLAFILNLGQSLCHPNSGFLTWK